MFSKSLAICLNMSSLECVLSVTFYFSDCAIFFPAFPNPHVSYPPVLVPSDAQVSISHFFF